MADEGGNPKRKRIVWQAAIGVAVLAIVVLLAAYLNSARFKARMRAKVIARLEQVTGGRVELKEFRWNLSRLEFGVHDLTIHGRERADEVPYAHVDHMLVHARIVSLLSREIGLRYVLLEHPVIHLIVYRDGTTNQPTPKLKGAASPVESVVELAIGRADVRDGFLLVNDRPVPLDFTANDVAAGITYAAADQHYDGNVRAGKIDTTFRDWRPVAAVAEATFAVWHNKAEIKNLRIASGRSEVTASGTMSEFRQPRFNLTYKAKLDVGEVAAIARTAEWRAGIAALNGQVEGTLAEFRSTGHATVRDLLYRGRTFTVADVNLGADYVLDNNRLTARHLFATVFGGAVNGDVEVSNWANTAGARRAAAERVQRGGQRGERPAAEQQGVVHLEMHNLLAPRLAAAINTPSLPLAKLNLAGTTNGTVKARWTGSSDAAVVEIAADVNPPAHAAPGENPLTAIVRSTYFGATPRLEVEQISVSTRATRLNATGVLGTSTANLRVALNTNDLAELKPLLIALHERELPLEVRGQASFTGSVQGKFNAPSIAGRVNFENFDSLVQPIRPTPLAEPSAKRRVVRAAAPPELAQPAKPPKRIHWDSFTADMVYSSSLIAAHNGVLRRGAAQVHFDFTANLSRGKFSETSPLVANINIRDAQLADMQTIFGYSYPVTGTVNLAVRVSGTEADPHGSGNLSLMNATLWGEPVQRVDSGIVFSNQQANFTNVVLAHNGARITGKASYNLATGAYQFDVRGTNFDLGRIKQLQTSRASIAGTMNFTAQGSGTREQPSINGNLQIHNLVLNGEQAGDVVADAVTRGDVLRLTARSRIERSTLDIEGTVRLRDDFPVDAALRFGHLDFDPLLRAYMTGKLTGHSSAAGVVELHGALRRPRELNIVGNLDQFLIDVEHVRVQNQGRVRFTVAQEVADIREFHLVGDDTDFSASGTVELGGARQLNLAAKGQINLKVLQSFYPDLVSYGKVAMDVKVGGVAGRPSVFGEMKISNAGLSYIDLPNGLADVNGTLVFNQDRLQIQQLSGRTGGGTLDMAGFIRYGRTFSFNLTATGHDIRLRYPPGVSAMANTELHLQGTQRSAVLSGDVTVTRFGVNPRFDFAQYLARAKQAPEAVNPNSWLNNLRLEVHITSTPELQVQTSLAKISGDADLRVRGTALRPVVLGRVNIIEGDVFFNGTKYHLERGDVTFTNPVKIEPVIDVEATTTVRDYDITLGFHGSVERLSTTYRSDPPLATGDIIALLAFGRTREDSALQPVTSQNFTETASNAILGQALTSAVGSRVQKLFGVSRIKIDPQVGGAENNPSGARITVEQQVANNLTITYITDLTRSNQQVIQAQYNINRNVSVVAVRDQNGVVSFDVRVRQRKK